MSKFSQKRLAEYLAKEVSGHVKNRRRVDLAIALTSVGIGAFGNFYFGKVEVGAAFLAVALLALGDWISSFWELRRFKRVAFDIIFSVIIIAILRPWLLGQYVSQHAALVDGELTAHDSFDDVK